MDLAVAKLTELIKSLAEDGTIVLKDTPVIGANGELFDSQLCSELIDKRFRSVIAERASPINLALEM